MDVTAYGRWRVASCQRAYHAACRHNKRPYDWTLSPSRNNYHDSDVACPDGYTFAAPRTALENAYLHFVAASEARGSKSVVWVNFNSLDHAHCWVAGVRMTCPYKSPSVDNSASVVIPTVAAVLVFVLTFLTVFVKCAANRQNARRGRRRKAADGWDYEGVPS